jgi:hypothetical protein
MMELTPDILLERRKALEADLIAINGAIQQVDWCLDKLEEAEDPIGLEKEVVSEEAASACP